MTSLGSAQLARGFAPVRLARRGARPVEAAEIVRDPAAARAGARAFYAACGPAMPETVRVEPVAVPGPVAARRFVPPGAWAGPPVLYVHGGGLVFNDLDLFAPVLAALALAAGRTIVGLDYPKAPETPPEVVGAHLAAALSTLAGDCATETGAAPLLAGDSIGGLAVLTAAAGPLAAMRPDLALVYPVLDTAEEREFASRKVYGQGYFLDEALMRWFRELARQAFGGFDPLALPEVTLAALGRVEILAAGCDVLRDEAAAFAERATAGGARVRLTVHDDLPHDFLLLSGRVPEARAGLERFAMILRADLSAPRLPPHRSTRP